MHKSRKLIIEMEPILNVLNLKLKIKKHSIHMNLLCREMKILIKKVFILNKNRIKDL